MADRFKLDVLYNTAAISAHTADTRLQHHLYAVFIRCEYPERGCWTVSEENKFYIYSQPFRFRNDALSSDI